MYPARSLPVEGIDARRTDLHPHLPRRRMDIGSLVNGQHLWATI